MKSGPVVDNCEDCKWTRLYLTKGILHALQVYINGEFVGGADILEQLSGSGELVELVNPTS